MPSGSEIPLLRKHLNPYSRRAAEIDCEWGRQVKRSPRLRDPLHWLDTWDGHHSFHCHESRLGLPDSTSLRRLKQPLLSALVRHMEYFRVRLHRKNSPSIGNTLPGQLVK